LVITLSLLSFLLIKAIYAQASADDLFRTTCGDYTLQCSEPQLRQIETALIRAQCATNRNAAIRVELVSDLSEFVDDQKMVEGITKLATATALVGCVGLLYIVGAPALSMALGETSVSSLFEYGYYGEAIAKIVTVGATISIPVVFIADYAIDSVESGISNMRAKTCLRYDFKSIDHTINSSAMLPEISTDQLAKAVSRRLQWYR